MPCFSWKLSNNLQPLCKVVVSSGPLSDSEISRFYSEPSESNKILPCMALLDTGANKSCISKRAAQKLLLSPMRKGKVTNTTGQHDTNIYKLSIYIFIERKICVIPNFDLIEIDNGHNPSFDIILGMDILNKGSLSIGGGMFRFCI